MKKITLACLLFCACKPGRNEIMTGFLNNKKMLQDSIKISENLQYYYDDSAKRVAHRFYDTPVVEALAESTSRYYMKARALNETLLDVENSIDSLSRMK